MTNPGKINLATRSFYGVVVVWYTGPGSDQFREAGNSSGEEKRPYYTVLRKSFRPNPGKSVYGVVHQSRFRSVSGSWELYSRREESYDIYCSVIFGHKISTVLSIKHIGPIAQKRKDYEFRRRRKRSNAHILHWKTKE